MDDLELSGPVLDQTLSELDSINKWLGGNHSTLNGLEKLIKGSDLTELHIVDLGCGSGDTLKLVADWGRRSGLSLKITGVDANPYIVDYARENTRSYAEIEVKVANILEEVLMDQQIDIIISTLFTHHFSDDQLTELILSWRKQAQLGIIINDLHRHWIAYYSISAITKLLSKSHMVRNDGPISVLRGFDRRDWEGLMIRCKVSDYQLFWRWAFRWLLVIPNTN